MMTLVFSRHWDLTLGTSKPHRYVLGLVDVLQEFNCAKAAECGLKRGLAALRGGHPDCMSVIPAATYARRLRHYIGQNTE